MGDETRCTCGHLWLAHDDDACRPDHEKCTCTGRTPAPSPTDLPDAVVDAAKAEQTPLGQPTVLPNYEWRWQKSEEHKRELREKLKAALARNAELEAELTTLRVRDEHYEILLADNLALRAELDNLRVAVIELATVHKITPEELYAALGNLPRTAIVRGSDDE